MTSDYEEKESLNSSQQEEIAVKEALYLLSKSAAEVLDEKYWVAEWLIRHGGSFARGIGIALAHADPVNTQKIMVTWGSIWRSALDKTEERRKNDDFY